MLVSRTDDHIIKTFFQDGLVHISELSEKFIKNPADAVKVHQKVTVTVLDVDLKRKRISLSMKTLPSRPL
jgi:uncharacterized protein